MALDGKTCGGLIFTGIQGQLSSFKGDFDLSLMRALCDAIGEGVVKHIQAAGQVQTTVVGSCSTGPVAGTGTGKVL